MIYLLIFYLSFAFVLYFVARKKGREPVFWAGLGFFFGPFALIPLLFSQPPRDSKKLPRKKKSGKRVA
ncbi:hypothetical protein Nhal_0273 [Nitrosococcus halophilus Nc 4]|uniref:Uncharacterized protein n=1 Tax=Nitrosococcus halophilus (strain Nc4) TaxID=472759 RepID=D5BUS4_NITHN|nr:hypothetical protein Nhal_0273 [Nitrosococcus halophilus Nc 4]